MKKRSTEFKKTGIGMIPEDWEIVEIEKYLEDIIDYRGKTPKKSISGIKTLSARSIKGGRIDYNQTYFISEKTFKEWEKRGKLRIGDVLLTTEGPLGEVALLDREGVAVAQRLLTLRGKEKQLDNSYLKYFLMSPIGQQELLSRATGTTVQGIKQSEFRKILILKPSFQEQQSIAKILSDIDSKIELNQEMNKTLEAIGQALFKRWFIDFEFPNEKGKPYKSSGGKMVDGKFGQIPKGWEAGRLGDICDITMGQSPPGSSYNESGDGMCFYQGITDFGFRFPTKRVFCTAPTRFADEGDVLLSVRAPVGALNMAEERCAVGRGVASVRLKGKHNGFLYYLLLATKSGWETFEAEGTVFGAANKTDVHDFKIMIPPNPLTEKFASIVEPMDVAIRNNEKESRTLLGLRDSLLPRLISGKIRVKTEVLS